MSAMAAAKMRRGDGAGGGKWAAPGAFVRTLRVSRLPLALFGGRWGRPPMPLALWVSKTAARWAQRRAGGSAARGHGVPGPRRGAPWPRAPAREKEYFVLSLK